MRELTPRVAMFTFGVEILLWVVEDCVGVFMDAIPADSMGDVLRSGTLEDDKALALLARGLLRYAMSLETPI